MERERIEKFKRVAADISGPSAIIIAQVDPDALGAALLLQKIIPGTRIFYCGRLGHVQNRYIFKMCDLFDYVLPIKQLSEEIRTFILVDSSSSKDSRINSRIKGIETVDPIIVIDHHEGDIEEQENTWICRETVGAASTLTAELFFALGRELSEGSSAATVAALGILTDTKSFTSAFTQERDLRAYTELLKISDLKLLQALNNYPLSRKHFEYLAHATEGLKIAGARLVTGVGIMTTEDEDEIATVADDLIRMTGINTVVVWGIVEEGKYVRISARNKDPSISFREFIQTKFGGGGAKIFENGYGEGGALIPLKTPENYWIGTNTPEEIVELMVRETIQAVVFERGVLKQKEAELKEEKELAPVNNKDDE